MPQPDTPCDPNFLLEPQVAAAVARAERRRETLEALSALGLALAREIADRVAQSASPPPAADADAESSREPPPEPRHDPGRAFAAVSRAVRLTLALEAKIDEQILALLRGDAPSGAEAAAKPAWTPPPPPDAFERRRTRISACVWDAIDEGFTDPAEADDLCLVVQERLMESEVYDDLFFRPLRKSVEAICKDLGLKPDWSRWDDEVGFPPETRRTDHDFTSIWATWPLGAKYRRQYAAVDRQIAGAKAALTPLGAQASGP